MKTRNLFLTLTVAAVCLAGPAWALDTVAPVPATATTAAPAPSLPFGVTEVIKMYQAGISKDVILGYIESTALPFHLTADGIIYLKNLGVPQEVTTALIRRDGQLHDQAAMAYQQQAQSQMLQQQQMPPTQYAQPGGGSAGPVATPSTPPPAPVYADGATVYPDYSGYPYDYGSYYWPPVVVGGGWWGPGWGWRGGFGAGRGGFGGFGGGFRGGFHGGGGFSGGHGGGGFGGGHGGGGHRY